MIVDKGEGPQNHYDAIEGFTFAWGTEVEATVRERKVANPPADGSSIRVSLVSIVEEVALELGTEFTWTYDSFEVRPGYGEPWIDVANGTLLDGTPFTCVSADACAAVQTSYDEGSEIEVTFAFGEGGSLELVDARVL